VTDQKPKELRLKGGSVILDYLKRFSATEKAVFGIFAAAAILTALIMATRVNSMFKTEVPAYGGTLREGLIGLPHTVNPVIAVTDVDRDISALVYAGLTKYDDGAITPDLAQGWTISPDGLTYSFTLRAGLAFQDGSPLTAADVVFTVEKIQDLALKSPRAADWSGVIATSTSPTNVTFILKQPYSSFLANTTIGIIPKHIWQDVSDDQFIFSEYNVTPVGAGPYKVDGVDRDQGGIPVAYRLSTWDGYAGNRPHVGNIVFSFFSDESKAVAALTSQTIDSLPAVSSAEAAKLASNTGEPYTVTAAPLSRIFGVFLNQNSDPVLADVTVRRALNMAVDRAAIIDTALNGYGVPAYGPLPPGVTVAQSTSTAASVASSTQNPHADIAGAQALLEKSGWIKGSDGIYGKKTGTGKSVTTQTLSLSLYTADAPELKQAADMVKKSWTALGASVDLKVFEPSDLYQTVIRTRAYDALLFGQALGKDDDLYAFWDSSQRNAPGLNISMYTSSKADKDLDSLRATTDQGQRAALFADLDKTIRTDVPAIFLYSPDFIYVVPKALHGLEPSVVTASSDRWNEISDWYLTTEQVWNVFAGSNKN